MPSTQEHHFFKVDRNHDDDATEGKTPLEREIPEEHRSLRDDQAAPVPRVGPTVLERDRSLEREEERIPEEDRTGAVYDHLGFALGKHPDPMPPAQDRQTVNQPTGPTAEELREIGDGVGLPDGDTD